MSSNRTVRLSAFTVTRPADSRQSEPDRGEPWKDQAACRTWDFTVGDPWFTPIPGKKGRDRWPLVARSMCDECPVKAMCARDAMTYEERSGEGRFGFVGGLTPEERSALALLGKGATA